MEQVWLKLHQFPQLTKATSAIAIKVSIVVFATIMVFFQDLTIIFNDALQNEATSYMLAIPFLLIYLVYRKRKMVKASIPLESSKLFKKLLFNEIVGAFLLFASFLLYWYGSYTFTPLEYHVFALPIFTSACILILFNGETFKQLLFPIAFLFLLVPPPEEIFYHLGSLLASLSSELAYYLLRLFAFPVTLTAEYGTPIILLTQQNGSTVPLTVDTACSGIYSQIGFLIFSLFIAYIIRDKAWKKTIIFFVGFPLIYLINVLRIFTIGIIGYYHGEDLALNVFHSFGGWILIFLGTLVLLVTSEKIFKVHFSAKQIEKCSECSQTHATGNSFCFGCGRIQEIRFNRVDKKDIAKATSLILAVIMILSLQTPVFALTGGPAELIVQTAKGVDVTTEIFPQISGHTLQYLGRDEAFETEAKQDASLIYAYFPNNNTREVIWAFMEIASTKSSLHRWETCLITWPLSHGYLSKVNQIELKDVQLLQNPPIIGRYFIFQDKRSNLTQVVLYWYEASVFEVNSTYQQKYVKISLIAYPNSLEEVQELKNQLFTFATTITGYWQPIRTWSPIALLISQNGDKLIIVTMSLLLVILGLHVFEKREKRKQNDIACEKLSEPNKQMISAVHETEKNMLPTLNNITKTYENIVRKIVNKEKLVQKLSEAEKIGLIKREIANRQDEPVQTWSTQCSV